MEIKSIKNQKIEYPKMNETCKKELKKSIPNKWMKLGITSSIFNLIMKNKVLANIIVRFDNLPVEPLAGSAPIERHTHFKIGSIMLFFISLIGFIILKFKNSKDDQNKKIKKLKYTFMVLMIISLVTAIICFADQYIFS